MNATTCPLCNYPREGLADAAPCPECGRKPAAVPPPLAEEPEPERRKLAAGARVACVSIAARIVHGLALLLAAFVFPGALFPVLWIGLMVIAVLNTIAGWRLTTRALFPERRWLRRVMQALCGVELLAAFVGGSILLASHIPWLAWTMLGVLGGAWAGRCLVMVAVMGMLTVRLRDDRLEKQLRGWLKYAGIAAMTPIVAVVAGALTALIPILLPITIIVAVPYLIFVGVLVVIAVVGAIVLQVRLARELDAAA